MFGFTHTLRTITITNTSKFRFILIVNELPYHVRILKTPIINYDANVTLETKFEKTFSAAV